MTQGWIVLPAYNEEAGIAGHLDALSELLAAYGHGAGIEFTVLVVDDGSRDGTTAAIEGQTELLAGRGVKLRHLRFVRNFGHQAALVAGLLEASASADFVITADADGEHPHALIPSLIEAWSHGAPIVHTVRRPDARLGTFKRVASAWYYGLLARVSGITIRGGMADFKLWDGELLRDIASFLPRCGSTRVFATWLAPDAPAIEYDQALVKGRVSRFTLRKMMSLALGGIVRYSDFPLRISLVISVVAMIVAAAQTLFVVWASLTGRVVPGWASLMIIVTFFGGMQSLSLGILGEYLLRLQFRSSLPVFVTRRRPSRR